MVTDAIEPVADILINNAGILRDKSFSQMSLDDFEIVVNVHLLRPIVLMVWPIKREQNMELSGRSTAFTGTSAN